jgi:hypothetical protein
LKILRLYKNSPEFRALFFETGKNEYGYHEGNIRYTKEILFEPEERRRNEWGVSVGSEQGADGGKIVGVPQGDDIEDFEAIEEEAQAPGDGGQFAGDRRGEGVR